MQAKGVEQQVWAGNQLPSHATSAIKWSGAVDLQKHHTKSYLIPEQVSLSDLNLYEHIRIYTKNKYEFILHTTKEYENLGGPLRKYTKNYE